MSPRVRDVVIVAAGVAVLLGLFFVLRGMRRTLPAAPSGQVPGAVLPAGGEGSAVPPARGAAADDRGAASAPGQAEGGGHPSRGGTSGAGVPADPAAQAAQGGSSEPWRRRPPIEFTAEDLAQCGRGVVVDLGEYRAAAGEEFTVALRLTAPALESLTLVLGFDPSVVVPVPGSAVPLGPVFRDGIECYSGRGGGTLVLIHTGVPGKKNLDAGRETAAVAWRMRALQSGATKLSVLPQSSFTNGRGEDEPYEVRGGDVRVR